MILSDRELKAEISAAYLTFEPFDIDKQVQDASIDVRLGARLRVPKPLAGAVLRPPERINPDLVGDVIDIPSGGYNLEPGKFLLGETHEYMTFPLHLAGRLEGRSSLARLGLLIHFTSAHIAPGFKGVVVLEMINYGPNIIVLTTGMPIGQIIFEKVSMLPSKSYSGSYQGQKQP